MRKNIKSIPALLFACFLTSCFLFASLCLGQEMPKPGQVIDGSNYKKFSHLFPEHFLPGFVDGWGGLFKPLSITVTESKPLPILKRFVALSEKNRGKCALDSDGMISGEFDNNGYPFPGLTPDDQDFATKMMWNYEYKYWYDDLKLPNRGYTKRKGEPIRWINAASFWMRFCGRLYDDPKPNYDNPHDLLDVGLSLYKYPSNLKNFQAIFYKYLDKKKPNDSYMYLPQMRRTLRGEAGQTSTPMAGSIQSYDDFYGGFFAKPQEFTYKFLGEQKVLGAFQTSMGAAFSGKQFDADPDTMPFAGDNWELRDVYLIEVTPKNPKYPQSKKICYFDKENLNLLFTTAWDRAGKPWKTWSTYWRVQTMPGGDKWPELSGMLGVDFQFGMGSMSCFDPKANGNGYRYGDFTTNAMLRNAR